MKLRHATPAKRAASIRRSGLLTAKSKGRLPAVWLHAPSRTAWAVVHTVKRHGGDVRDVVVLTVTVPRSWCRRSQRGLWACVRDVPPSRVAAVVICFDEVAASPARA